MSSRMHGLSCPTACGILVPWPRLKITFHALQGKFLATGSPGKSLVLCDGGRLPEPPCLSCVPHLDAYLSRAASSVQCRVRMCLRFVGDHWINTSHLLCLKLKGGKEPKPDILGSSSTQNGITQKRNIRLRCAKVKDSPWLPHCNISRWGQK